MLQLDAPEPPAMVSSYLERRAREMERHHLAATDRAGAGDDWREQVRERYALVACQFLEAAMDPQTPDLAVIVGVTLADGWPQLQSVLASVTSPPANLELRSAPAAVSFENEFQIIRHAQRALGPMFALMPGPPQGWPSAWPPMPPTPTLDELQTMQAAVTALPVPPHVRDPLTEIVRSTARGVRYPEFTPFVDEAGRDLRAMIHLIETVEAAGWLDPALKRVVHDELGRVLIDYRDAGRRDLASSRLGELLPLTAVLADAGRWRDRSDADRRNAELLVHNVVRVLLQPEAPSAQRQAIARWYQRARDAMRIADGAAVPDQATLRTAYLLAERDRTLAMDAVMRTSAELVQAPAVVSAPSTNESVRVLRERSEALRAVSRIKTALDAVDTYRPTPATGVRQRIIRLMEASKKDVDRDWAMREAVAFVHQFERYASMPGEATLREGGDAGPLLTPHRVPLLAMIDTARTGWATAWASGIDPDAAQEVIGELQEAMACAVRARPLSVSPGWTLIPDINAWGGWQGHEESMRMLFAPLEQQVSALIAAAAAGDLSALGRAAETRDVSHDRAMVVLQIASGVARVEATGFAGILAQVALKPEERAYMVQYRGSLALLNRCINEWAYADEAQRIELEARIRDAIRRMRDDLPALGLD